MGVRYQPPCSAARYSSTAAAPFGSTDAMQSGSSWARAQNPSATFTHLPGQAPQSRPTRDSGRGANRFVAFVGEFLGVPLAENQGDPDDEQHHAEDQADERSDEVDQADLKVRGIGDAHVGLYVLRRSGQDALVEDQLGLAADVLEC